ncbi:hypothetical protein [Halalkalicoccus subterraneus]|uniref:hypothetical protein n=1 Tax=Halalkalicoccus subterraneus TaxID=2675002 RepID=UPI000EFD9939|nr:hypothetical protein [Halalkalicoccus subterraneus]
MENQRLRERFATIGTFFTFFGLLFVLFKEFFEALSQIALTPWGSYLGVVCFVVAAFAFTTVVYLDETHNHKGDHPRLSK